MSLMYLIRSRVLFTISNGRTIRDMYQIKRVSTRIEKLVKGIHSNGGRLKRYLYQKKGLSMNINKLVKGNHINGDILTAKLLKI